VPGRRLPRRCWNRPRCSRGRCPIGTRPSRRAKPAADG
jgi:hypothetical protein